MPRMIQAVLVTHGESTGIGIPTAAACQVLEALGSLFGTTTEQVDVGEDYAQVWFEDGNAFLDFLATLDPATTAPLVVDEIHEQDADDPDREQVVYSEGLPPTTVAEVQDFIRWCQEKALAWKQQVHPTGGLRLWLDWSV